MRRPADLTEPVGDGLGDDHVVDGHGEGPAPVRIGGRPGARGEHYLIGAHAAGRGHDRRRPAGDELRQGRALVDTHAPLEQDAAQLTSELGRLHRREVGREGAADEARRVCDAPRLGGAHRTQPVRVAVPRQDRLPLGVGLRLPLPRAGVQDALVMEVDLRVVPPHPRFQLVHLVGEGLGIADALVLAEEVAQRSPPCARNTRRSRRWRRCPRPRRRRARSARHRCPARARSARRRSRGRRSRRRRRTRRRPSRRPAAGTALPGPRRAPARATKCAPLPRALPPGPSSLRSSSLRSLADFAIR